MRILFFGTPRFAVPSLAKLVGAGHVVRCVTRPDRPQGRTGALTASPVAIEAARFGIPCGKPEALDASFCDDVRLWQPDVAVLAAYGKLIKLELLAIPKNGFLNLHPSLLPRHRGASPVAEAIRAGDQETGVTIMLMDEGLDTGPILAQTTVPVHNSETTGTLTRALADLGAQLLLDTLPRWMERSITPIPQEEAHATMTRRFEKDDGRIDWHRSAREIERAIRAYDPWPGTFTEANGERYKILRARIGDERSAEHPGTVLRADTKLSVVCGDGGTLDVLELQLAGKKPTKAEDFLRGAPPSLTRFR